VESCNLAYTVLLSNPDHKPNYQKLGRPDLLKVAQYIHTYIRNFYSGLSKNFKDQCPYLACWNRNVYSVNGLQCCKYDTLCCRFIAAPPPPLARRQRSNQQLSARGTWTNADSRPLADYDVPWDQRKRLAAVQTSKTSRLFLLWLIKIYD